MGLELVYNEPHLTQHNCGEKHATGLIKSISAKKGF